MTSKSNKERKFPQYGALAGPPDPINDRIKLRLLVSDELKKRRGIGSSKDRVERSLERSK